MAGPASPLAVTLEPLDYEFGGWCPSCALPTGVQILAMMTIGPAAHLRTFNRCSDCQGPSEPPEVPDVDHL